MPDFFEGKFLQAERLKSIEFGSSTDYNRYGDCHFEVVYPPMQSPFNTLNRHIVEPLLSHREWKSSGVQPCSEPL